MMRVKICCIRSSEEAALAVRYGASALGLVSAMPSGPGVIPESRIAEIAATVPPPIGTFLLTSRTDPAEIAAQHRRCRTTTIQICDRLSQHGHAALRKLLPGVSLVRVVHVTNPASVVEAVSTAHEVDALLLDSGNQALAVKELGGTGRTHDWSLSAQIVEQSSVPVFLAGGLHPGNVADAIRSVRPFGLDLCTGVRTNERLDEVKLRQFMAAVESAVQQITPAERRPATRAVGD